MKEFRDRVAVITGAASGIGLALARRCVGEGMKVVLADIHEEDLRAATAQLVTLGGDVLPVPTDVAQRCAVELLAQRALEHFGGVHLLVNNAGVAAGTSAWDSTWNDWEWVIGVNLWGVIHGVKVFTPIMLSQGEEPCHIVNTASAVGMLAFHPSACYQTAKAAVVAFSENLYLSLRQRKANIQVSLLCPGNVATQILSSERNRPRDLQDAEVNRLWQGHLRLMRSTIESGMAPDEVAQRVFQALLAEQFYIFTHPEMVPLFAQRLEDLLHQRNPRRST